MASASLFVPAALLVVAGAVSLGLRFVGPGDAGRLIVATAAWLAVVVVGAAWFSGGRSLVEAVTTITAGIAQPRLRVDAVTILFQTAVLLPAALLLTFQRRSPQEAAAASLATAAALVCLEGGSLLWTAVGLAVCLTLVRIYLGLEDPHISVRFWVVRATASLLLVWTAVLVELAGGTSVYGAIPVTAVRLPAFAVMVLAAVLCSGLWPWRTWVTEMWTRSRLEAGTLTVALVVPLGFYPLVRAYGMGAGQWPSPGANVAVTALGVAVALGAAVRAQAAETRRGYLAETVPLASGLALAALGLGTPLGLVAALTGLLAASVAAGVAPLVPGDRGPLAVLAVAVVAGAPPAVVFGGWLLTVQAALEAGTVTAFLGLAGAAAWLLGLAAAARAVLLPPEPRGSAPEGSNLGSLVAVAFAVVSGVALAAVLALLAIPAASEVKPPGILNGAAVTGVSAPAILGAGSVSISTASGGWSSALLAGPFVVLALAGIVAPHLLRRRSTSSIFARLSPRAAVRQEPPAPFFAPPLAGVPEQALTRLKAVRLPEQYRSLFRPALVERAAGRSGPWLWVAATIALTIAVTR